MVRKSLKLASSVELSALLLLVQATSALAVATAPPLGTTQSFGVLGAPP